MIIGLRNNKIIFGTHSIVSKDCNHICFSAEEKEVLVNVLEEQGAQYEVIDIEQPGADTLTRASAITAYSIEEAEEKLTITEVTDVQKLQDQIDTLALAILDIQGV